METLQLFVKAGSCMIGGDGRICALQSSDCPSDTTFVSSHVLESRGTGLAHGGACATVEGTEVVSKIGACPSENRCASDASVCMNPSSFVSTDDRCTIRMDGLDGMTNTMFGKCMSDNTCYWSQQDCIDQNTWKPPGVAVGDLDECTCENVRVGACKDTAQDFYYCAVSANACAINGASQFIDARTLMNDMDAPDCFLCRDTDVDPIAVAPSVPDETNKAPTFAPSQSRDTGGNNLIAGGPKQQDNSNNLIVIIGVSVGGAILLGLAITTLFLSKQRRAKGFAAKEPELPVATIDGTSSNNVDIDELSDVGYD